MPNYYKSNYSLITIGEYLNNILSYQFEGLLEVSNSEYIMLWLQALTSDPGVLQLVAMGFEASTAAKVMRICGGDLMTATELLLSGQIPDEPIAPNHVHMSGISEKK